MSPLLSPASSGSGTPQPSCPSSGRSTPDSPSSLAIQAALRLAAIEDASMPKFKILIADDDSTNLNILELFMKKIEGVEVKTATNGKELVRIFNEYKPNLIITDIEMPEMNGDEACEEIRKTDKTIPIFAQSSLEANKYISTGFTRTFVKPLKMKEVSDLVKGYLKEFKPQKAT